MLIPLTKGAFAVVDAVDAPLVIGYRWHIHTGYAARKRRVEDGPGPIRIFMHSVILNLPDGVLPDHVDRDKLNNRRSNLRPATETQNRANSDMARNNTSGFRGVRQFPNGRWQARLGLNRQMLYLGCFDTPEEAALAYDAKAREVFGDFAWLNFPDHG